MKSLTLCCSILLAQLTRAHFDITYPGTRGDSFWPPASQWLYPCAGINATTNRTMWPTTGGSLVLDLHHPFTYIWVNLGLGEEVASFNVSLTPNLPYNETGNGTLCLPHVALPEEANVTEGAVGSLQVITVGDSGSALYNCADLMFTSNATLLTAGEGECVNSTGVSITRVEQQTDDSAATTSTEASTTASIGNILWKVGSMVGTEQSTALRYNEDTSGRVLNATGREHLLKPYLPSAPKQEDTAASVAGRFRHTSRVRPAIRQLLHWTLFAIIHTLFSVYIRLRQVYHAIVDRLFALLYYHHRTPELIQRDVKGLSILKSTIPHLHRRIERTLTAYYGSTSPQKPTFSLRAPHLPSYSPPESPEPTNNGTNGTTHSKRPHLNILLISTTDGRQTLVDLTRTLASMAQDSKIQPSDISDELIDAEITESVMGEPDLLLLFGDRVTLKGYPPWQVRLTEIYGVQDHVGGVEYAVFLRGLYRFAKAKMNFGR
ncbi:hypothetical protein KC340_g11213 [Hortaea werneckii]|nr:hypothetical protein KC339_g13270 [Hortaea werneckii]KAI7225904.1 hypothetical protein KC365_g9716 [Hortaea werneckii]KAI7307914.1 hypothetical protein KC340_g11213 [Hortaea werneckii]KAI7381500.1 hypothetical protein KC328_g12190 [Hortaea werneckii]